MSSAAIDIHAHHVAPAFLQQMQDAAVRARFPHCAMEETANGAFRFRIGDEAWTRPVMPGLIKLGKRTEKLAASNISVQLNGGWLDLFGYSLPADEGAAWSTFLNDALRESLSSATTSDVAYLPLATVPLQDGAAAAAELERTYGNGHAGAMIGTYVNAHEGGYDLDHANLEPFWAKAAALGAPIFLHPAYGGGGDDARIKDHALANAVARPNETALAMAHVLYGGVLERYPNLKLVISHGGGALGALLGRLTRNYLQLGEHGETVADPRKGYAQLYFDSVVFEPNALAALVEGARPGAVMLGSDDPFPIGDPQPRAVVESADLHVSDDVRSGILAGNARAVFTQIDACCAAHVGVA